MKITVILTSYNHEKYIEQSIESVLNQSYRDFEFIIVDDCSSDNSWNIICDYQKKYPEIITIRHEYNWHGGTVEDVVKNYATGEYIALHHSDDVWDEQKLEKQVTAIKNAPECVAVFTNAQAIDDDGNDYQDTEGFYYNLFQTKNRSRQEWLNYFFYKGNCLCHPSILIRKDVYEEDDFFRKGLRQIPDFVKWIQVCRKHEIYVLPEKLVKFRVHKNGNNESGMRGDSQIRSTIELFLMLSEYSKINEYEEFIKVFPEVGKYAKKEAFIWEFSLGMICIQEHMQPYTRLFGVELIYKVLNVPEKRKILEEYYHYTMQDFMDENGKHDIFNILPDTFEQKASIYIDTGSGYNENEVYKIDYTLNDEKQFCWRYNIHLSDKMHLFGIRFDPAEGIMVSLRLEEIIVNRLPVKYITENALCTDNGNEVFLNLDPIYQILIPNNVDTARELEIIIVGKEKRLNSDEISRYIQNNIYIHRRLEQEKIKLEQEKIKIEQEKRILEEDLKIKTDKLEKIKNMWIYKYIKLFINK